MKERIENLSEKKLIGCQLIMSLSENRTPELWRQFMPMRNKINSSIDSILYSIDVYDNPDYFHKFDFNNKFTRWAAIEVTDFDEIPTGLEVITIPQGLYVVFLHKGNINAGFKLYNYIFTEWFPNSKYNIDQRPHFCLMGDKYINDDDASEEEFWIPVKEKIFDQ